MLGLADRGRVLDLFDRILKGDAAAALSELSAQYADGADPMAVLRDLAEITHWISVIKITPEAAAAKVPAGHSVSAAESLKTLPPGEAEAAAARRLHQRRPPAAAGSTGPSARRMGAGSSSAITVSPPIINWCSRTSGRTPSGR